MQSAVIQNKLWCDGLVYHCTRPTMKRRIQLKTRMQRYQWYVDEMGVLI